MKLHILLSLLFMIPVFLLAQQKHNPSKEKFKLSASTLAERLGFLPTDKILIINGDDAGMSHAMNAAVTDALENGLMTTSTIMVPCPWFLEIPSYAKTHPESDFGIHLTHTCEWEVYKWGPAASKSDVPGLIDPQGYLWQSVENVYAHTTPEQTYIEARAQIEKALAAGMDITHLDSHMGVLQLDDRYFQMYRKLANEYNLPLRMASQELLASMGAGHQRQQLEADHIICPDYLIYGMRQQNEATADFWKRILQNLKPGVTELFIHASLPAEEMKFITNSWQERAEEYRLFTKDKEIRQIIEQQEIKLIGYRPLLELQRVIRAR